MGCVIAISIEANIRSYLLPASLNLEYVVVLITYTGKAPLPKLKPMSDFDPHRKGLVCDEVTPIDLVGAEEKASGARDRDHRPSDALQRGKMRAGDHTGWKGADYADPPRSI